MEINFSLHQEVLHGLQEYKMIKKSFSVAIIFLIGIFLFMNFAYAETQNTYCAERTLGSAWCQNVPLEEVNKDYRYVPTNCESTSYCKLGTCIDSQEGLCMENTPQRVCEESDDGNQGVWFDAEVDEIPQCSLGCCLLGDEAAFVTQPRCKQLSSLYGLETTYRTDINSEIQCISTATSKVKGACVFEEEFERTCKFVSRGECESLGAETEFHEDFLCSAEVLGTNCGPSEKTTLVDGKDEVYFVDTCGNVANVYDSTKQNDKNYWKEIFLKGESCGFGQSNAGSETCGNCNYFLGSTGKSYDRLLDPVSPKFGDNICRDLSCDYLGGNFQHGETWCSKSTENEDNLPGSRYHRLVCYNGEVSVESCADFRQEVCIQDVVNNFKTAACRVNKWQDCITQTTQKECVNENQRDCKWLSLKADSESEDENVEGESRCVPKYAPGFDFWQEGDAESLCALADNQCVVKYEKGIFGEPECVENCECITDSWGEEQNNMCISLGDCGAVANYKGQQGYHEIGDMITISEIGEGKGTGTGGRERFP